MTDVFSKKQRSYIISRIRKTDTKPELLVRKYLFSHGLRYRLYNKNLPGKPDIVLPKYRIVIFVNGCFWHAHKGCKLNKMPKTNKKYWIPKIEKNVLRDLVNKKELKKMGWHVMYVWECELRKNKINKKLNNLILKINNLAH